MPLGTVLIIMGVVLVLNLFGDFKKAKADVAWMRENIKKECESKHPADNYIALGYCSDGRYGTPRQWWEKKTYAELLLEYSDKSASVKENPE